MTPVIEMTGRQWGLTANRAEALHLLRRNDEAAIANNEFAAPESIF